MLPLGMASQDNSSKLVPVQPSEFSLVNTNMQDMCKIVCIVLLVHFKIMSM